MLFRSGKQLCDIRRTFLRAGHDEDAVLNDRIHALCPLVLHICGPVAERADIRLYEILREHVADKAALCENLQRFFGRLRQLAAGLARKVGLWQLRLFEVAVKPRINERSVRKVRIRSGIG